MVKVLIIHGIGNHKPDYTKNLHDILGINKKDLITFHYEDLLEASWYNKVTRFLGKNVANFFMPGSGIAADWVLDYLNDIQVYKGNVLSKATRKAVIKRLATVLSQHTNLFVIGHSLGSYVAYDTFQWNPSLSVHNHTLITIGSPIGGTIGEVWERVGLWTPTSDLTLDNKVRTWINVYSPRDRISGKIDSHYKCDKQIKVYTKLPSVHSIEQYLKHCAPIIHNT